MYKVLFVGLGKMGFHMSGYLSKKKNINLSVYNRTKNKEKIWKKKFTADIYNFNSQKKFDFVITCLKDDEAITKFFEKFIKTDSYHKDTIVIDHSTISLDQINELNKNKTEDNLFVKNIIVNKDKKIESFIPFIATQKWINQLVNRLETN